MPKYVSKGGSKAQQKQRTGPIRSSSKQLQRNIAKNANSKRELAQKRKRKKLKLARLKKKKSVVHELVKEPSEAASTTVHNCSDAKEEIGNSSAKK